MQPPTLVTSKAGALPQRAFPQSRWERMGRFNEAKLLTPHLPSASLPLSPAQILKAKPQTQCILAMSEKSSSPPGVSPAEPTTQEKIEAAFEQFRASIYPCDDKTFRSTELKDVYNAVRAIERSQSERRCLRNTRRIQPLFDGLKLLGNLLEPLCQGVPFLCYIWACFPFSFSLSLSLSFSPDRKEEKETSFHLSLYIEE